MTWTDRDTIDTIIAEKIMGWTNVLINDRGEMYAETPESKPGRTRVIRFTTSLDATHTAAWVLADTGKKAEYLYQLNVVLGDEDALFDLVNCGPFHRALALAKTVME